MPSCLKPNVRGTYEKAGSGCSKLLRLLNRCVTAWHRVYLSVNLFLFGCVSDSQSVPECQSACRNGLTSSSSHIVQRPRFISSDSILQRHTGKSTRMFPCTHTCANSLHIYYFTHLFPRLNLVHEMARWLEWKLFSIVKMWPFIQFCVCS